MLLLKSCPKCKGDLQLRNDFDGFFLACIQCGYAKDFEAAKAAKPKAAKKRSLVGAGAP